MVEISFELKVMIYVTILITERVNEKTVNLVTPVSSARAKVMD
jgi:flagellar assembly factor FliW